MKYIRLLFLVMTWALALVLTITFFRAFASPTQSTIIYVNRSGEALFEAILCPVITTGGLWAIIDCIWRIVRPK